MRHVSRPGGDVPTGAGGQGVRVSPILVGRDELLALAERCLGSVGSGSGHLLFLSGEAGVGKTRLLREIAHRAAASGFMIIRAGPFLATPRSPAVSSSTSLVNCGSRPMPRWPRPGGGSLNGWAQVPRRSATRIGVGACSPPTSPT
jgi:hypothetical protein